MQQMNRRILDGEDRKDPMHVIIVAHATVPSAEGLPSREGKDLPDTRVRVSIINDAGEVRSIHPSIYLLMHNIYL